MDKAPTEPGDEAAELDFAKHPNGFGAADRRHRSLIEVSKRRAHLRGEFFSEEVGDVAALLHRDRGEPRQGLPFFIEGAGRIADDENFGMVRDREIGPYRDASLFIERHPERL